MSSRVRHDGRDMQIKKRPTAIWIAGALFLWSLIGQPIWNLNIERLAEKQQIDSALSEGGVMSWFNTIVSYVPNSFGLGFAAGALIFAYWDILARVFSERVLRKPVEAPRLRPWVGRIVPHYEHNVGLSIWIYVINVGEIPFIYKKLEGAIRLSFVNGSSKRVSFTLPAPLISNNPTIDGPLEHGKSAPLILEQRFPRDVINEFPDAFTWKPYPNLGLEDLKIIIETPEGQLSTELPLWESIRMSTGETEVRYVETFKAFPDDRSRQRLTESLVKVIGLLNR